MEYYVCKTGDELYHWGIKGMKWGIRRYQNKDGSLTNAGKKRRAKLEAELKQLGGKKKTADRTEGRSKPVSEMTDKELQKHTARMQLEKNFYEAQANLNRVTPKQMTKGQKFAESMLDSVVKPMVKDAGQKFVDAAIKKAVGSDSGLPSVKTWDDMIKKQQWEGNERTRKTAEAETAKQAKNDKKNKNESSKTKNDSSEAKDNRSSEKTKSNTESKSTNKSSEKVYEGTVEGVGNSSKKSSTSSSSRSNARDTVIDADWSEVNVSSVPAVVTNAGRSYISGLLESSSRWDDD